MKNNASYIILSIQTYIAKNQEYFLSLGDRIVINYNKQFQDNKKTQS